MIELLRLEIFKFVGARRQRAYARRRADYRRFFWEALSSGPVFTEKANPGGANEPVPHH